MLVVKLGGSLYNTKELKTWLDALSSDDIQQSVVIVPGGGPFADQIRSSQQIYKLNDSSAHHMALLAMAQFGILLSSLNSQYIPFYFSNMTTAKELPPLSIWLPDPSLLSQVEIEQSWNMTADSLALWLAMKLHASQLLLIKREPLAAHRYTPSTAQKLSDLGIIDRTFPTLFNKSSISATIMHYQGSKHLLSIFADNSLVGINILRDE